MLKQSQNSLMQRSECRLNLMRPDYPDHKIPLSSVFLFIVFAADDIATKSMTCEVPENSAFPLCSMKVKVKNDPFLVFLPDFH